MLNYIVADFYRIFKKKSFYIFLAFCSLGFIAVNFIASGSNYSAENYTVLTVSLLSFVPIFVGVYVFSAVYTDDLRSKSLQTAIGFGKKRSEIILVKLIDASLLMLVFTILIMAHVLIVPIVFGVTITDPFRQVLLVNVVGSFIKTIGFFAISSIAVFFFQKSTPATTLFILLSTGTLHMMASMLLTQGFIVNTVGNIQPYLFTEVTNSIVGYILNGTGDLLSMVLVGFAYIVVSTGIAIVVFNNKELEF